MKTIFLSLFTLPFLLDAQSISLGASLLASNYSGDMTPSSQAILKQTSMGCGLNLTYELDHFLSIRSSYECIKVYADDQLGTQDWQINRGLNFNSRIHSIDLSGMINVKNLITAQYPRFNAYAMGGYTFFNYNPIARYNGTDIALRPLGTEGQGMKGFKEKYSSWGGAINFGFNFEFLITEKFSIESQLLFRKTNTDYIDDLSSNYVDYDILSSQNGVMAAELGNKIKASQGSQRGNPLDQDWYQSLSLGLKYRFYSKQKLNLNKIKKGSVHCPKFKF